MNCISFDFSGATVVVTGAARGIGREVALGFASAGAIVYLLDFDPLVEQTAAEIGGSGIRVDVANSGQVDAAIERVVAETGRIDVLVNNAGILRDQILWHLTDDDWDVVQDVHLGGTFRVTRACVPHFREQGSGRIINVSSYSGLRGNTGQTNYSAAKAGIIGFTKAAAKELSRFGVTVNAISPNAATRMVASIPPEKLAELTAAIPLGRFAEPEEIFPAIAFLASPSAGYITGVVLPVDGGMSM